MHQSRNRERNTADGNPRKQCSVTDQMNKKEKEKCNREGWIPYLWDGTPLNSKLPYAQPHCYRNDTPPGNHPKDGGSP